MRQGTFILNKTTIKREKLVVSHIGKTKLTDSQDCYSDSEDVPGNHLN